MFEWKSEYTLGIKEIDLQHGKLLEIGAQLFELMSDKDRRKADNYDEIIDSIEELKAYTVYHFDYEEGLLEQSKYSDLDEHCKHHNDFIAKLEEINLEEIENMQIVVVMELISFIAKWIEEHILVTDQAYLVELKQFVD